MKIASIVGARPQFIKLAPLVREITIHNKSNSTQKIKHLIIHTGQHYDYLMDKIFFDELGIPEPDYNLEVGSGSHGWQTGEIVKRVEKVLMKESPDWVLVYGDTNSTLGGALAASKLHIHMAHIEAGLRSYNKRMPEEINRILTDHCSDILFCPTWNAVKNLEKEGFKNIKNDGKLINKSNSELIITNCDLPTVMNVGDIMYDAFLISLSIAEKKSTILDKLKLRPKGYFLATIHRAENTDNKDRLKNIIDALNKISEEMPVIFPIHPRTKKKIDELNNLINSELLRILNPVGYFDMIILEKNANKILTDSGGVQKEAFFLKVPCITLRNETEWIETIIDGLNILVGTDKRKIVQSIKKNNSDIRHRGEYFGEGETSKRIIKILMEFKL